MDQAHPSHDMRRQSRRGSLDGRAPRPIPGIEHTSGPAILLFTCRRDRHSVERGLGCRFHVLGTHRHSLAARHRAGVLGRAFLREDALVTDRPSPYSASGEHQLAALVGGAGAPLLREFFRERTRECDSPYQHFEFITVGLFDDLASSLSPGTAFDLIPAAVGIAIDSRGDSLFVLAIAQLGALARASGTTETPPALDTAWDSLQSAVDAHSTADELGLDDLELQWRALADWYRRR